MATHMYLNKKKKIPKEKEKKSHFWVYSFSHFNQQIKIPSSRKNQGHLICKPGTDVYILQLVTHTINQSSEENNSLITNYKM
jgi:hypothetical protein